MKSFKQVCKLEKHNVVIYKGQTKTVDLCFKSPDVRYAEEWLLEFKGELPFYCRGDESVEFVKAK